jgi:tripartite ATP-independent transporter DctP family solute receptor
MRTPCLGMNWSVGVSRMCGPKRCAADAGPSKAQAFVKVPVLQRTTTPRLCCAAPGTRGLNAAAILAWALAAALSLSAPAAARDFRAADTQPENYPTVQALAYMDRIVTERTGGRHRIRIFHSRQLGEEKETIEQTRVGAIDLNRTNVAPLGSFIPEANVLALPFLFRSIEHLHKVLDGPVGEDILASFEPHCFGGLAFYDSGARSLYNAVRPVRSLGDLKGLRIRVQQSDVMVEMIRALGAEPVEMPYGQVLTGLSTKLIDGAENNWPSYVSTDHYTAARYVTLTEHTMGPEVLVMSQRAWASLSPDEQAMFRDAARASSRFMREQWKAWEERSRAQAEKAGNTVVGDFDKAPFQAAMTAVYDKALAGSPKLRELVERIRQTQ